MSLGIRIARTPAIGGSIARASESFRRAIHRSVRTVPRLAPALLLLAAATQAGPTARIPANVSMVAHVDFDALLQTGAFKSSVQPILEAVLAKAGPDGAARWREFSEGTGINPGAGLRSLTIAIIPTVTGGFPPAKMYSVLEGQFDRAKLEAYAEKSEFWTAAKRGDLLVIEDTKHAVVGKDQGPSTWLMLDSGTLIVTATRDLDAFLAVAQGSAANVEQSPLLGTLLRRVKTGQFRSAVLLKESERDQLRAAPQFAPLAKVQGVSMSYELSDGIRIQIEAMCETAESSKAVLDTATGILAAMKMTKSDNPALAVLYNRIHLEQDGAFSKATVEFTSAELAAFVPAVLGELEQ